jgi:site-specific recombinase XerD
MWEATVDTAVARLAPDRVEEFLLTKKLAGCTTKTLDEYRRWLDRFAQDSPSADPLGVRAFFSHLAERGLRPTSQHKAFGVLKTFFRWCIEIGALTHDPLAGFTIRLPKTLPRVPTEDEVRDVLRQCPETFVGRRNRALILVLADAGLRAGEVLRLLIEDWTPQERSLFVRCGKGRKDRVVFLSPTTARAIRAYLAMRHEARREDYLFVDAQERPLTKRHLVQILHRLSVRAGLPRERRIHPHALRHFAATAWLRSGMGLDEVRRLLGHESLSTTLRYSSLVSADLQRAHRRAGALERMRLE